MMYQCCYLRLPRCRAVPRDCLLRSRLRALPGIVSVTAEKDRLHLWYRGKLPLYAIQQTVSALQAAEADAAEDTGLTSYRREAVVSIAGFLVIHFLRKTAPLVFADLRFLRTVLVLAIARNFIRSGICSLFHEHRPNADTLTATAVIASALAGKPESSLTLLALSNGAEMLTSYAAERTRKQISGLLNLNQRFAWRIQNGIEKKVPVETIGTGDHIAAHLGEKICIDGRVISGSAAVNQSSITGESNPAIKQKGSPVYAGSIVEAGEVEILVEKVGRDTSLAHIVHLVETAQTRRAPVQNFADRMSGMLVPISFLGAAIVYGATRDWQRVLNLLFIDFSCGLKLSTATAISAAIGAAAKKGILVKGGNYIEALAETDTVVLDKTGTITAGVPQISFVKTAKKMDEKEVVLLAASAEQHSVHPLAVAIQRYVKAKGWQTPQHRSSKTILARGMQAKVPDFENYKGGTVLVGSCRFMEENRVADPERLSMKDTSQSMLYIARNKRLIGLLGIRDPIRPQMKKVLHQMRRYGIDEIVMLTGDAQKTAAETARSLDIDAFKAEILPEDKADYVMKLKKHGTGSVLMVGDGINDAPALAFADVGVTLGGRQTDIAAESSAVTIRSENPMRLMELLRIGRRTMHLIQQNFTATIVVNSAAMLLGALGRITPFWAAVIHNTATLAVVLNSTRIFGPFVALLPHERR